MTVLRAQFCMIDSAQIVIALCRIRRVCVDNPPDKLSFRGALAPWESHKEAHSFYDKGIAASQGTSARSSQ